MICKYDIVIILLLAEQIKCLIIWKEHHEAWGILCHCLNLKCVDLSVFLILQGDHIPLFQSIFVRNG